jgi:hypothetical protein
MHIGVHGAASRVLVIGFAAMLFCCSEASADYLVAAGCATATTSWQDGWAIGRGDTEALATQNALRACDASIKLSGCCRIMATAIYDGCMAIVQSDDLRTTGYGPNELAAYSSAMDRCARKSNHACKELSAECVR